MRLTDEQLQSELRELRETPSEDFAAELDAWAEAGFPATDKAKRGSRKRSGRRRIGLRALMPALGYAAPLILIAIVIVAVPKGADEDESADSGGDAAPMVAPESADERFELQSPDGVASRGGDADVGRTTAEPLAPGAPRDPLKPGQDREQERTASMTLKTDEDEVDSVADGVVEVTERYDGIVFSANVTTGDSPRARAIPESADDGSSGRATFDLRIPTANLQAALSDLSDLASVSNRSESTLDITAPFISAEERFRDASAEVDALLEQLSEADSATEIESIRAQLRTARGELAAARRDLAGLKQRSDFSRLNLTVLGEGDGWSIGDAVNDALGALEDITGAGLLVLIVVGPILILIALVWWATGRIERRLRESALDK